MANTGRCPKCGGKLERKAHGVYHVDRCKACDYQVNVETGSVIPGHNADLRESLFLNCPNCSARLSTPKNRGLLTLDCPYCLHKWNFDTGAPKTSETQWSAKCPQCGKASLVNKNEGPRKITCPHCQKLWRFQSDTGEHLPDAEILNDTTAALICPQCGAKNKVPRGKGNLLVTCARCGRQSYLLGDPNFGKTAETPKTAPKAAPKTAPKATPKAAPKTEPKAAPKAAPKANGPGFFEQARTNARARTTQTRTEIQRAENSLLLHLIGMNHIQWFSERSFYDMVSDPGFGGIDFNVHAEGVQIRFFDRKGYDLSNPDVNFKRIKNNNREEWGADAIDKEFDRLESPAARKAFRTKLLTDYISKIPYLDVDPKIGRATFNGVPYGAPQEPKAAPKGEPESAPQTEEAVPQAGIFGGVANFFRERKDGVESEIELVTGSPMNRKLGEAFSDALREFLPEITDYNYLKVSVFKKDCHADLYYYDSEGHLQSKRVKMLDINVCYNFMKTCFDEDKLYSELHSLKAKKKVRDEIYEVLSANYPFLYRHPDRAILVILEHLM